MGKQVRASELRAMPSSELTGRLETLRKELWQARLSVKEGALQQTHGLQRARRQIARIHTVLGEQQKAARPPGPTIATAGAGGDRQRRAGEVGSQKSEAKAK